MKCCGEWSIPPYWRGKSHGAALIPDSISPQKNQRLPEWSWEGVALFATAAKPHVGTPLRIRLTAHGSYLFNPTSTRDPSRCQGKTAPRIPVARKMRTFPTDGAGAADSGFRSQVSRRKPRVEPVHASRCQPLENRRGTTTPVSAGFENDDDRRNDTHAAIRSGIMFTQGAYQSGFGLGAVIPVGTRFRPIRSTGFSPAAVRGVIAWPSRRLVAGHTHTMVVAEIRSKHTDKHSKSRGWSKPHPRA
jgi:hypothetical protein